MNNQKNKVKQKGVWQKKCAIIVLLSLVIFLALFLCAYFIIGNIFFDYALNATFAPIANAPSDLVTELPAPKIEDDWLEKTQKEQISYESEDGYCLKATQILNDSNIYVISIHGYRGKGSEMSFYAKEFYDAGYNVVLPDLKGHGQSEGKYVGMGYFDKEDILCLIDEIIKKDANAKIVLHGVSMGGATVMMTVGEKLPENVVCGIEDCGFSNAYEQFDYVVKNVLKLPFRNIIMSSSNLIAKIKLKISLKDIDSASALKKSKTPMLFIHGSADDFVPFYMLDKVYGASDDFYKEKLVVDGATHAYSATKDPDLYFSKVLNFIEKFT